MSQTPAGWYDDGRGSVRYWDGSGWTEHVAPAGGGAAGPTFAAGTAGGFKPSVAGSSPSQPGATDQAYTGYTLNGQAYSGGPGGSPAPTGRIPGWLIALIVIIGLGGITLTVLAANGVFDGATPAPTPTVTETETETETPTATETPTGTVDGERDPAAAPAEQAVMAFDEAWITADCDAFFATTTSGYRTWGDLGTCEDFEAVATPLSQSNYVTVIVASWLADDGESATVTTDETYDSPEGGRVTDRVFYTLVLQDGTFLVERADYPELE